MEKKNMTKNRKTLEFFVEWLSLGVEFTLHFQYEQVKHVGWKQKGFWF